MDDDPAPFSIRRLTQADAETYRPLRLEALRLHPEAFSADFADEARMSPEAVAARMSSPPGGLFGAFVRNETGEALAGVVGLVVQLGAKLHHKGLLVGMYVAPPHRHGGVGGALVRHVIGQAHTARLHGLRLGVTVGNEPARRLYMQFGFRPYGVEPDAISVEGRFYDEELMALRLG